MDVCDQDWGAVVICYPAEKKWIRRSLLFFLCFASSWLVFGCSSQEEVRIGSDQKLGIYKQIAETETSSKSAIPIFAIDEDNVFFVVYDISRLPNKIVKIQKFMNGFSIDSVEIDGRNRRISRYGLKETTNAFCYRPNNGIVNKTKSQYETYSTDIYAREVDRAKELEAVEYCFYKNFESSNSKFDVDLFNENSKKMFLENVTVLMNAAPEYKRKSLLEALSRFVPLEMFLSVNKEVKKSVVMTPYTAAFPVANKVRGVLKAQKISLSPDSGDYVVNQKASESLNTVHYAQIDESCIVFEKNTNGTWSYVSIIDPSWLMHVSGWVPSDVLSSKETNYYKKCIAKGYYIPFNVSASPQLYKKLKAVSGKVDGLVESETKKLTEKFFSEGVVGALILEAKIDESSGTDDIIVKFTTTIGVYLYSSKNDSFTRLDNKGV